MIMPDRVARFLTPNNFAPITLLKLKKHPPWNPTIIENNIMPARPALAAKFQNSNCVRPAMKTAMKNALSTPIRSAIEPTVVRPSAAEKFMIAAGTAAIEGDRAGPSSDWAYCWM